MLRFLAIMAIIVGFTGLIVLAAWGANALADRMDKKNEKGKEKRSGKEDDDGFS
jgi:hypothetical protein